MKYAAALLLMLCSIYTYQQHWKKLTVDDLFARYYEYQYTASDFQKFIQLRNTNYFLSGTKWLASKNYATAIKDFRNYLLLEPKISAGLKSETYFYMGIACIELNQSKNAKLYFEEVKKNMQYKFYQQSEWYIALNLLKQHQVQETINQLNLLVSTKTHSYYEQAKNLLQELR